jgi:magnesium-transporting ATPase (P-type)
MDQLRSQPAGLHPKEAADRLEQHGKNSLPEAAGKSALQRFLAQFHNLLIYILLAAALVTAALGHWLDSLVIAGVVLVNSLIGFVQEGKARQALESIRKMLSLEATVLRDGNQSRIAAESLVPGDIVLLKSGDKVPADLRLIDVKNLEIEEAILTGESEPARKAAGEVAADAALGDRRCMAFSSTMVTQGKGLGVVVETGRNTEIGRISGMVAAVEELQTPLLRKIGHFGKWLSAAIGVGSAAVFLFGWLVRDYTLGELFLAVVSIAVAAIPEGLPPIMTITLAIGVRRMAARHAIIRRLPAVETLGSVTVICAAKTGTLTRNEMAVAKIITAEQVFDVTGTGYGPEGTLQMEGDPVEIHSQPVLLEMVRAGILCNDSKVVQNEIGHWRVIGNPTEGALHTLASKAGLDPAAEEERHQRLDAIPFESDHKYMATLHDRDGGWIIVKGAPERILQMCRWQKSADGRAEVDHDYWERQLEETASQGNRLLAIAVRPAEGKRAIDHADVGSDLVLLGFFGLMDPPREAAIKAVAACHSAGISVKMITGDHAATARSIARMLGIGDDRRPVTGKDLAEKDPRELADMVADHDVFARTSPENKLSLVQALQARNELVAMTGDGVNDAPALKRADIGIAMGIKGSEAAKEAAEMVLADDNFASIVHAVEEGRTVYGNLRKTILFLLPTNGGQCSVIIAAILAGMVLPIIPVQILWVNMVTVVTLAMALAFESAERDLMKRPPIRPDEPILTGHSIWRIGFVSVLLLIISLGGFLYMQGQGTTIEYARSTAVNMLVAGQTFYLFNCRSMHGSAFSRGGLFGNQVIWIAVAALVLLQAAFTYAPFMQNLFGTASLDAATWGGILVAGFMVFLLVELEKFCYRKWWLAPATKEKGSTPKPIATQ